MGLFEEELERKFLQSYRALIDTFPLCVGSAKKRACAVIYDTGEGSKLQNAGYNLPTVDWSNLERSQADKCHRN